ncbi:hypothetical protein ACFV24_12225 [Nocardia fluminea]
MGIEKHHGQGRELVEDHRPTGRHRRLHRLGIVVAVVEVGRVVK